MDRVKAEQSIREQILDICKKLFDSNTTSIQNYEEEVRELITQGIPSSMVIAEFDSCTRSMNKIKEGYRSNEIVRAWRYSNNSFETIQMVKEPELSIDKHKNYKEVYARYAFSVEKRLLYLNIFYAPLSARGYVYHIIESEGFLRLSEAELEWIS